MGSGVDSVGLRGLPVRLTERDFIQDGRGAMASELSALPEE
jgi:hypothetical protein